MLSVTRVFDAEDQECFARISSDRNPIHLDSVAARRTQAGTPIVHGVHSLIWMLDCFAKGEFSRPRVQTLRVQFLRPIFVGETVHLDFWQQGPQIRSRIASGNEELVTAFIGFESDFRQRPPENKSEDDSIFPPSSPIERTLDEMVGLEGRVRFGSDISQLIVQYPAAAQALGARTLAELAYCSCLVGMVVPGLHSMFSGLDIALSNVARSSDALSEGSIQFAVSRVSPRFRLVRIAVMGRCIYGDLETVSRNLPARQPNMDMLTPLVSSDEFRGATALVVGGSRGLGELTAKLAAAGGAEVLVTYATGRADALRVVDEITKAGGSCVAAPYDIRRNADSQLSVFGTVPTHVYYFATPLIFQRKAEHFAPERFAELSAYYTTGFFNLVQACRRLRPEGLIAFYPSTTYISDRPTAMTEYAMAKAAGELLCSDLSRFMPGLRIVMRRLPRLPTDQTLSMVEIKMADPIKVILPIVREMHLRA